LNTRKLVSHLLVWFAAFAVFPSVVAAQQPGAAGGWRRWEVEVHGGFGVSSNPRSGSGDLPPRQRTLPLPTPPLTAPIVPTWFVEGGPIILNDAIGATRMQSIDAALSTLGADWGRAGAIGARIARRLSSTLAAELSFDYLPGALTITDDALFPLREGERTFPVAFEALFAREPETFVNPSASASLTLSDEGGGQVITAGTLNVDVGSSPSVRPYLAAGGGVVMYRGATALATLVGQYSFAGSGMFPIAQSDTVVVRDRPGDASFAPVLGGGVRVSRGSWGLRADVRMLVVKDSRSVTVDATPATAPGSPAGFVIGGDVRLLSFSNDSSVLRSSLSGSLDDFETFRADGRRVQTSITFGVFRRF